MPNLLGQEDEVVGEVGDHHHQDHVVDEHRVLTGRAAILENLIESDQLRLGNDGREQVLNVDVDDPTLHLLVVVIDDGLAPLGEHSYAIHPPVIEGHHLVAFAEFLEDIPPLFQLLLPSRIAGDKSTAGDADEPLLC